MKETTRTGLRRHTLRSMGSAQGLSEGFSSRGPGSSSCTARTVLRSHQSKGHESRFNLKDGAGGWGVQNTAQRQHCSLKSQTTRVGEGLLPCKDGTPATTPIARTALKLSRPTPQGRRCVLHSNGSSLERQIDDACFKATRAPCLLPVARSFLLLSSNQSKPQMFALSLQTLSCIFPFKLT